MDFCDNIYDLGDSMHGRCLYGPRGGHDGWNHQTNLPDIFNKPIIQSILIKAWNTR